MANTNIVRQIAYKYKLPIAQVKKILASYESYIEHSIINKKQVKIFNIGSLKIVDKKSRTITLP
jgi:nucleoid DNA-binding protein